MWYSQVTIALLRVQTQNSQWGGTFLLECLSKRNVLHRGNIYLKGKRAILFSRQVSIYPVALTDEIFSLKTWNAFLQLVINDHGIKMDFREIVWGEGVWSGFTWLRLGTAGWLW
jgi:hypothetical protein